MDETEAYRRQRVAEINQNPTDRELLEKVYGQVWDTKELGNDFQVHAFAAPYVIVTRKSDGKKGSMEFQDRPRFYYGFQEV